MKSPKDLNKVYTIYKSVDVYADLYHLHFFGLYYQGLVLFCDERQKHSDVRQNLRDCLALMAQESFIL